MLHLIDIKNKNVISIEIFDEIKIDNFVTFVIIQNIYNAKKKIQTYKIEHISTQILFKTLQRNN